MLRYITFPGSSSKPMSPGEPGLFSEMVSVPTSGKQIKDERETFKNFLQAINLMPRVAEQQDTASTFSVSTRLRYIHVHQVDGGFDNLANKGKGSGKSRVGNEDKRKGRRQVSEETKHWLYVQYFCQQRSLRGKLIRCFLDPVPRTHVIGGRPCCSQAQPPRGPLSKYRNTLSVLQNFAKALLLFSLGTIVSPRRKWKHCLCKFGGDKQRVLWYFPNWPICCTRAFALLAVQ